MTCVTLTFDNGPDPAATPFVLDTLAAYGVRGTFFVVGERAARPDALELVARAHGEGHWVGNHSWTHSIPFGLHGAAGAVEEIDRTQRLIAPLARQPALFRPFGGGGHLSPDLLNEAALHHLCARRFTCVLWNAIPRDWADPDGWVDTALRQIESQDWSLVVLHDISSGAMRHLPRFLQALHERGWTVRQDFPPDCVPIVDGAIVRPIDGYVTRH